MPHMYVLFTESGGAIAPPPSPPAASATGWSVVMVGYGFVGLWVYGGGECGVVGFALDEWSIWIDREVGGVE